MARKNKGQNKHQKAAHRVGEQRVSAEEMEELLVLSESTVDEDRILAASYLCPCHIRRPDQRVWTALYRMMEDPNVRGRRAAWHTLEDGGCPTDSAFEDLLKRRLETETDEQVRGFVREFAEPIPEKERSAIAQAGRRQKRITGRCDFCGENDVPVVKDLDTMIPTEGMPRPALLCKSCSEDLP